MSEKNSKKSLYIIIGVLAVIAIGLAIMLSQEKDKKGFSIEVSEKGIEVEEN